MNNFSNCGCFKKKKNNDKNEFGSKRSLKKKVDKLLSNNKTWADKRSIKFFKKLSKGQSPGILWIGCSDSRTSPDLIIKSDLGQVFTHRNIANLVQLNDKSVLSVIEYAVLHLNVSNIVICGHSHCGGVKASINETKLDKNIEKWIKPIRKLKRKEKKKLDELDPEKALEFLIKENVKNQVKNILKINSIKGYKSELGIHGLYFNLENGIIENLECSKFINTEL